MISELMLFPLLKTTDVKRAEDSPWLWGVHQIHPHYTIYRLSPLGIINTIVQYFGFRPFSVTPIWGTKNGES